MLCDLMLERWLDGAAESPLFSKVEKLNSMRDSGVSGDGVKDVLSQEEMRELKDYLTRFEEAPHLCGKKSIPYNAVGAFQDRLKAAHKFHLTTAFISATFNSLATPDTIIKAKEWFALIHNPMWMEWQLPDVKLRFGALLYSKPVANSTPITMCYFIHGQKDQNEGMQWYEVYHFRLLPDTLRKQDDGVFRMDIESDQGLSMDEEYFQHMSSMMIFDYIVRLNSPRITDFQPPEDLSRINKKRAQLGRLPLCGYQVVDLNKAIKLHLKQVGGDSMYGTRFHWRRGHFKVRKSGIFWWNPHTAGRKAHGEIHKEYIA